MKLWADDARDWWKHWSNRLALLAAAALAWSADNQDIVLDYLNEVPSPWRSALVFAVTFIVPVLVRSMRQGSAVETEAED